MTAEPAGSGIMLSALSRQNALYRRMITICDRVGDAALRGTEPGELTSLFARLAETTVVLLDPSFRLIAEAGDDGGEPAHRWHPWDAEAAWLLKALERERRTLRIPALPGSTFEQSRVATPISVGDVTLGYLLVTGSDDPGEPDDVDLLITTYAATLFALAMVHQRASVDLGQRYRAAILDALVSGNFLDGQDAHQKAATLGLSGGQPFRVALVGARPAGGHRDRVLPPNLDGDLGRLLAARVPDSVAAVRGSDLVILLPAAPATDGVGPARTQAAIALDLAAGLLKEPAMEGELTCGLSEPLSTPEAGPRGLQQASDAIDLGVRIGRAGSVVAYEELGVYRLLLQIGDMRQLWKFAEDVLGALITYEADHSLDLIGTLSVYLQEHASLKRAAWRLRVHTNTITYRISRIEDLTGLKLTDAEDRLSAHVAVKIIESQRAGRTVPGIAEAVLGATAFPPDGG